MLSSAGPNESPWTCAQAAWRELRKLANGKSTACRRSGVGGVGVGLVVILSVGS